MLRRILTIALLTLLWAPLSACAQSSSALLVSQTARRAAELGAASGHEGPTPLTAMRRIVIDPGHGGTNEGAIGVGHVHEKHLTLPIALALADRLRARYPDIDVRLTRQTDTDVSLVERIALANSVDADLFISLHFNAAGNTAALGFESFWTAGFEPMPADGRSFRSRLQSLQALCDNAAKLHDAAARSELYAANFNRAMRQRFNVPDRGVKRGDYTVLTRATVPAVVVEMGFLSHPLEGKTVLAPHEQARMVDALVDSIAGYDLRLAELREQQVAAK
ncbi:MAG: N-acetylmuramoyl-L-alanine amidase [Myxococcota bacterium]|nr:N-acetylmuramoyl-L-alanine amidase [Myxococcota bacterium]